MCVKSYVRKSPWANAISEHFVNCWNVSECCTSKKSLKHDIGQRKLKGQFLAGFVWKDSLNWTAMLEQAGYQHFSEVKPNCDFSFIQLPFIFHGWWTWFISVWPHTRLHILLTQWLCLSLFFAKLNVVRNNLVCWNHSSLEWNGIRQMRQIFFSFKLKCGMGSQNCFGPSFHKSDANWYLIKKSTKIASTIIALKFQVVTEQLKYFFLHFLLTAYYFYFSQTKTIFINFRCYCQELKRTTEIIRNQEQLTHSDMNNF